MSPKAEVSLPHGITQKSLQGVIAGLGGRVLSFNEIAPIKANDISPSSLARFLEDQNPKLGFSTIPEYPEIFSQLRQLPQGEQNRLLVGFCTKGVIGLPNGEKLGEMLAKINNIPWFQPEKDPNPAGLQQLTNETLSRLNLSPLPVRLIRNDWGMAWNTAWTPTFGGTREILEAERGMIEQAAWDFRLCVAGVGEVKKMVRDVAWEAAVARAAARNWPTASRAAECVEAAVIWTIVKNLMPLKRRYEKGNPFEPLLEIYKLGCWPIGPRKNEEGKEEFVIFVPPVQKTA